MANIKQQRKRVKIAAREQAENRRYKSRIRTMFRSLSVAAGEGDEKAAQMALELTSVIDRAAGRGMIHANNAARKKARIAAMVNLPEGAALPKGEEKTEPAEGRESKAERRAERGKARHKKKAEARARASERAEAEAAAVEESVAEEAPAEEAAAEAGAAEEPAAEEATAEDAAPEAEEAPAEEEPAEEAAEAAKSGEEEAAAE